MNHLSSPFPLGTEDQSSVFWLSLCEDDLDLRSAFV
jgi:hypothetical protein